MKKQQDGFSLLMILLILLALGIIGFVGWYVYKNNGNYKKSDYKAADYSSDAKSAADSSASKESAPAKTVISDALKENTAAAIESQNTAALEGYMEASVTVVFAASEKGGAETPTQAIQDLDYLQSATSPWDFKLTAAVLTTYKNGFYGKYFGDNTIVGKSANDYVVSFGVSSNGKINSIFVAANADLLQ